VSDQHADDQSERRNNLKVNERLDTDSADLLHVTDGSDALNDGAKDYGRDHHFDERNKAIPKGLKRNAGIWEKMSDQYAEKDRKNYLCVENGVPWPALPRDVLA
jgi:hypothetical protein